MTQEERQLLLEDLCIRLPFSIKFHDTLTDTDEILEEVEFYGKLEDANIQYLRDIDYIKPYLRSLSTMTDEEKVKMSSICLKYATKLDVEGLVSELLHFYCINHLDFHNLISKGLALEASEGLY